MNESEHHHVAVIKAIAAQFKPVMEKSGQAVYIYLDDTHKVCNKKFAGLLGYQSAKEWADTEAPLADVIEEDQPAVVAAYEKATENMEASCLDVRLKHVKTGKIIKTRLIMVPVTDGEQHVFAMHFLSRI